MVMKVAIVGTGIAGMTTAHLLSRRHAVQVFEAEARVGGHTHTVNVTVGGNNYAIDSGFIVYNERNYPRFSALLERLSVATQPSEMSFSVQDPSCDFEYNGHNLNGLFAQRRRLISPRFWALLLAIARFNKTSLTALANGELSSALTLRDWLTQQHYSEDLLERYLIPMGAAIWSASPTQMYAFPAHRFLQFFQNHGLLSLKDRPQWRTIRGGSHGYIGPLIAPFREAIHLSCPVRLVERDAHGVTLHTDNTCERFDKIVFACHSDQALQLIAQPSAAETQILGAIPYSQNDILLHTDTRLLPRQQRSWASWNYRLGNDPSQPAAITYNMNILQGIKSDTTFCISLNQNEQVRPELVLGHFRYAHPQYGIESLAAQARWRELLGAQHSFFCGAYWGHGFHEDGVTSALRVAAAFGESL